jgi:hypothetical protein
MVRRSVFYARRCAASELEPVSNVQLSKCRYLDHRGNIGWGFVSNVHAGQFRMSDTSRGSDIEVSE